MKNNLYGVIIKVDNIDNCRSFYRDVLDLGEPVLDSNFWVEFRMPDNFVLILEKTEDSARRRKNSSGHHENISWFYRCGDIDKIKSNLKRNGYPAEIRKIEQGGLIFYAFNDPEGNSFYVAAAQPTPKTIRQRSSKLYY